MNAIAYLRVSTDDQADRGHSIPEQKAIIERYCDSQSIRILKYFTEDYSGKTFDRPEWNDLKAFVKTNNKDIDLVLVSEWDRLGRNQLQTLLARESFQAMGVTINAVMQPIQSADDPDSIIMSALHFAIPEADNVRRRNKVIGGTRRALKSGYFVYKPPFGYQRAKLGGKVYIEPHPEEAQIVKWIFERYSTGMIGQVELRTEIRRKFKVNISKTNLMHLLKRETYLGRIKIKQYKHEPEEIVEGLHEAIISDDLFHKVQNVISGKSPVRKYPKTASESFPLRGQLVCSSCGQKLTASSSKGRSKYYHYYHCQKPCKERHKVEHAHESLNKVLREISIPDEHLELFKILLEQQTKANAVQARSLMKDHSKEIVSLESKIEQAEQKVFEGQLPYELFERQSQKHQQRINFLKTEIAHLKDFGEDISDYIESCSILLNKLDYWFETADIDTQQKLIGSIFPQNLVFDGTAYRTAFLSPLIQAMRGGMPHFTRNMSTKKGTPEGSALLSWPNSQNIEPLSNYSKEIIQFYELAKLLRIAS